MSDSQPDPGSVDARRFAYFMVRLHRLAAGGDTALTGVIERLGTGEKQAFASAAELSALLDRWCPSGESRVPSQPPTREER